MADIVGNRLGPRGTFEYVTDSLEVISMAQDDSVGKAVGNVVATTNRRPQSVNSRYLKGRYILVQRVGDPSITKRIVIGSPANPLMTAEASSIITINSAQFVVTGRVGEQVSFLKLTPPAPDPN